MYSSRQRCGLAVAVYADGRVIEMETIGREGCTGIRAAIGAESSFYRLLVQIPGGAAKMTGAAFMRAMSSVASFRTLIYAYLQAFLEQVLVSVARKGAHGVKQRLARWLLMMRDRSDDDTLQVTQSLLAEMLGVHRPTVTNAARELERAGLISRGRRQLSILDRHGLAEASYECYQLVRTVWFFTFLERTRKRRYSRVGNVCYRHVALRSSQWELVGTRSTSEGSDRSQICSWRRTCTRPRLHYAEQISLKK
jgi:CRP-like cAMP-binding protein